MIVKIKSVSNIAAKNKSSSVVPISVVNIYVTTPSLSDIHDFDIKAQILSRQRMVKIQNSL